MTSDLVVVFLCGCLALSLYFHFQQTTPTSLPPPPPSAPPPPVVPNNTSHRIPGKSYNKIHQRHNYQTRVWEAFELPPPQHDPTLAFTICYRHQLPDSNKFPFVETWVHIKSDTLKEVLQRCLKYVDAGIEPEPVVSIIPWIRH